VGPRPSQLWCFLFIPKNKKLNVLCPGFELWVPSWGAFQKQNTPRPTQRTFLRRKSKKCLKSWQHFLYVHLKFAILRLPGVKGWIRIWNCLKVGSGSEINHSGSIALIFYRLRYLLLPTQVNSDLSWCQNHCCRSMTFWCGSGSGSGSADPCLWLMNPNSDPDPDPAIFVIDLQEASKKLILYFIFPAYFFLKVHLHLFSKIKSQKESQNSKN
jgi:hypothetical protein